MTASPDLYLQCAICRLCEGAAHLSSPVLGHGRQLNAPILAVAQNPGVFSPEDIDHVWWSAYADASKDTSVWQAYATWTVERSTCYSQMARVFGDGWLETGAVYWTNAVRCRTPDNARPSDEMLATCKLYTEKLMKDRKAIIAVGAVARAQLFGDKSELLPWGVVKRHPDLGAIVLAIKHYAAWGRGGVSYEDEVAQYRTAFVKLATAIGLKL